MGLTFLSSETLVTFSSDEMKSFFDPCVDGVVELIQGQIQQVERTRNRVKVRQASQLITWQ